MQIRKKKIFRKKEDSNERKTIPRKRPNNKRRKKKKVSFKKINLREHLDGDRVKFVLKWAIQLIAVCILAFLLVYNFGERISNIGDSMSPNLKNGDIVLVNRFTYKSGSPKRGDVIIFKPNGNKNSHFYIKRVIGLPGETIEFLEGSIYIDGEKLEESYDATDIDQVGIVTEKMTLGKKEYFVLGDDRSKSEDSRMANVGNVKESYIYGKAWMRITSGNKIQLIK